MRAATAITKSRWLRLLTTPRYLSTTTFPLKNVTKSNFDETLKSLTTHVKCADFIAIDLEMTGVTSAPWRDSFEYDRFDVRYLKVKDSAEKFALVQFGVCPFKWDPLHHSFIAHPHNFFVFPRQEVNGVEGPAREFLCQTASVDFLAKYQFDFNTCINEGVSYLSRGQEEEALRHLDRGYGDNIHVSWHNLKQVRNKHLLSTADVLFSERMKIKFTEWSDGLLRNSDNEDLFQWHSSSSMQQIQTVFYKLHPALKLSGFTSHQLNLIKLLLAQNFKDLTYICVHGENSSLEQLIVYTDSEDDKESLMKEVRDGNHQAARMKIQSAAGFRRVIELLSSEKKLIVGHNCFLDLAHIYSKFLGPLPSTAEEFVSSVNKCFPHIIDTKILLTSDYLLQNRTKAGTSLSKAFLSLCPQIALGSESSHLLLKPGVKVEVHVDDLRSSNWNSGAKHEAGYDAFMTGCVFAQACNILGVEFKLDSSSEHLALNEKLQKHVNLLYLSWTNGDIINMSSGEQHAESLGSSNPNKRYTKIAFENIVLVWGFKSTLKAKDIKECICKVFGPTSVTSIYHLDVSAVFVEFKKVDLVNDFLALKGTLEETNNAISVLHPLSKLLEGGNTQAASYETYKEICSSPMSKILFADQAEEVGIRRQFKGVESICINSQDNGPYEEESSSDTVLYSSEGNELQKMNM